MRAARANTSLAGSRVVRDLRAIVGRAHVLTAPADLALYAYDSSPDRHPPGVVVFPASTAEVAQVVQCAARRGVPFVPRGAGTNLSGGSVPVRGGIVIALSRLNRLLAIDTANYCAVVEPGLTNLALQDALAEVGWVFHPDPASQKVSTIGGNVAENAGGPHCLKYGVTTNHILGLRVVLPGGEVADFGGPALDAPGYDLVGLMNGSEGTFGIITAITTRIFPRPEAVRTLLAIFDSLDAASEAVSAIIAAGIIPASLEMMDQVMIGAIQASMDAGYPLDAEAVLIIEVDGLSEALEHEARRCADICRRLGAREVRGASSEREREQLWAGRRGAFGAAARLANAFVVNDGTVPRTKLPEVLRQTQDIAHRYGLRVGNNFHAGDGNLHPLILLDGDDPAQRDLARRASVEMLQACIAAGGSISGEHGIGSEKREAMTLLYAPADLEAQAALKRAFDPHERCNPGKVLPDILPPIPERPRPLRPGDRAREVPAWLEVDGKRPAGLLRPQSEGEVAGLLAGAAAQETAVMPFGAATKLALGMPPQRLDYAMCLAGLAGVIEHDHDNLTVTVRAGTCLADLQRDLAARGQWLALDPPHEAATIGGIIAANSYGPGRMRLGACRDLVLGLRVALPSGDLISVGGKTVKNVSGYDLAKLFIGSLGTVGVITAATFKLAPLPPCTRWRGWAVESMGAAMDCAHELAASALELTAGEVISGELVEQAGAWVLVCRAQGVAEAVERQLAAVASACARHGAQPLGEPDGGWRQAVVDAVWRWPAASVMARISVQPARLADAVAAAWPLLGESACAVRASPALGVAHLAFEGDEAAAVPALRRECAQWGGAVVLERAPVGLKLAAGVWGAGHDPGAPPGRSGGHEGLAAGESVVRALKAQFDPRGVLNPGRFVGGI